LNNNTAKQDNFHDIDFSICTNDTGKLLEQLQESSLIFWKVSMAFEKTKRRVADLKLQIKIKEADIGSSLRNSNTKVSEMRIDKAYFEYPDYIELNKELNIAKQMEGQMYAYVRTLEQRHSLMISVVSLLRHELRQQI
jgi:hypothetical protein